MIIEQRKKIALSIILLIAGIAFYGLSFVELPGVDRQAKEYYESSLKRAVIAYASIRGLNAVVSVIKESDLEMAPTGLGVSLAVGQVLDPVDDMVERVSDVLVVAIAALGTERIIMEVGTEISFKIIAFLLLPLIGLVWYRNRYGKEATLFLSKVVVFLLIIRFFLPFSAYLNGYINTNYLDAQVVASQEKLDSLTTLEDLSDFKTENRKGGGILSQLSGAVESVKEKTAQLQEAFIQIKNNSKDLIKSMVTLTTVYIVAFVVQVLLIPLLTFWGLFRLSRVFIGGQNG